MGSSSSPFGDPDAVVGGSSARLLHQRLFDVELALTNIARFAQAMARSGLPAPQRFEARLALRDVARGENEAARTHAALTLIDPRGRQVAHAVAGADGAYWLDAPAAGAYALLASAGSHRPAASTVIVRETAHGSGTVVNVVLADTSGLAGTVPGPAGTSSRAP
jgi:hypothetical protein